MPKQYNLVPKEFIPAALEAAALVTRTASERDWEGLEGLVQQNCILGIRRQVDGMSDEERKLIVLNPEDAFLSFISNERSCNGGKDVNLVVYFYPDLHTVRDTAEQMNQLKREADEKIKKDIFEGNIKNTTDLKGEFVDFNTDQLLFYSFVLEGVHANLNPITECPMSTPCHMEITYCLNTLHTEK